MLPVQKVRAMGGSPPALVSKELPLPFVGQHLPPPDGCFDLKTCPSSPRQEQAICVPNVAQNQVRTRIEATRSPAKPTWRLANRPAHPAPPCPRFMCSCNAAASRDMSTAEAAALASPAKSAEEAGGGGGGSEAPDADLPKALLKRILKARLSQLDVDAGGDGKRDFQINKVCRLSRKAGARLGGQVFSPSTASSHAPCPRWRPLTPAGPCIPGAGCPAGLCRGGQAVHPLPDSHRQRRMQGRAAADHQC